jgi:GMP synthase-like glutamine amidotransferase
MKPVAIFQHYAIEGPGYFATFLLDNGIPWQIIRIDQGEALPESPAIFGGLCFMGGPMSVNDDLPWIPPVLDLIRDAVRADIPVIGHCLGGQLIAKALGGIVSRNPVKEIGWGRVAVVESSSSSRWLGDTRSFEAFHWHGETFSIPDGATRILESAHCPNQAYVLGRHLGMQCHVEMTEGMIAAWCEHGAGEIAAADSPAVQTPEEMKALAPALLGPMRGVADRLYGRWIQGLWT